MFVTNFAKKGVLYVVSSPSGGGKTSIVNAVRKKFPGLKVSVSYTSRPQRKNEVNGVDYFFVSKQEFAKLIEEDFFVEYAEVFGNFYGVPRLNIQSDIENGIDYIFSITYHGYIRLRELFHANVVGIFILPESEEALRSRLAGRKTETPEAINVRLSGLDYEISTACNYDYLVINDKLSVAVDKVSCIITSEKLKYSRLIKGE